MTLDCNAPGALAATGMMMPPFDLVCGMLAWKSSSWPRSTKARAVAAPRIDAKRLASVLDDCAVAMWPKGFARALTPDVEATMQAARITPWELLQIRKTIARATSAKNIPTVTEDCDPDFPEQRYLVLTVCIDGNARRLATARSQAARAIVESVPATKRRHYRIVMDTPKH